jgi:hypothetical protein
MGIADDVSAPATPAVTEVTSHRKVAVRGRVDTRLVPEVATARGRLLLLTRNSGGGGGGGRVLVGARNGPLPLRATGLPPPQPAPP